MTTLAVGDIDDEIVASPVDNVRTRMFAALTSKPLDWFSVVLVLQQLDSESPAQSLFRPHELAAAVCMAARAGKADIVALLFARGARVRDCGAALRACAEWRRGHADVARLLRTTGCGSTRRSGRRCCGLRYDTGMRGL
jgi:hypothetical protein